MKRGLFLICMTISLNAAPCFAAQWSIAVENTDHTSTLLGNISSVESSPNGCIANVHYEDGGHLGVYKIYYGDENTDDGCFNAPFDKGVSFLQKGVGELPDPYLITIKSTSRLDNVNSDYMILQNQVTKKTMTTDEFEGMVQNFETQRDEAAGNYSGHPLDEFVNWAKGIHAVPAKQ